MVQKAKHFNPSNSSQDTSSLNSEPVDDRYPTNDSASVGTRTIASVSQAHCTVGRPFVSILVPAYNEGAIISTSLSALYRYMTDLEKIYQWEIVVVNDGSKDDTAEKAEAFAKHINNVHVIHHLTNFGLGQALKTGFEYCKGDYIVTLDIDLTYSVEHIEKLLTRIRETGAKVVVASPYMEGGKVSNVPWLRKELSYWANKLLSFTSKRDIATLTGMVRAYDAKFLQILNLRSGGMDINPEVIYRARLLDAKVEEIPGHLDWQPSPKQPLSPIDQAVKPPQRKSSMKIFRQIWATVFYGFIFRPVMFFIIPSLFCLLLSMYGIARALSYSWRNYQQLALSSNFASPTQAVAAAFQEAPHTFIIGGMTLMLAIQLFSLGVLAMQSKHYFEEIFYLGTSIYNETRKRNLGSRQDS